MNTEALLNKILEIVREEKARYENDTPAQAPPAFLVRIEALIEGAQVVSEKKPIMRGPVKAEAPEHDESPEHHDPPKTLAERVRPIFGRAALNFGVRVERDARNRMWKLFYGIDPVAFFTIDDREIRRIIEERGLDAVEEVILKSIEIYERQETGERGR